MGSTRIELWTVVTTFAADRHATCRDLATAQHPACGIGKIFKGRPSLRRSLQPQNRKSSTSKHEISQLFSIFVVHFCPLDLDPDQKQRGSESESATLKKLDLLFHLERV
jgi:hypothetical protein